MSESFGHKLKCLVIDDHPIFGDAMAMTIAEIFEDPEIHLCCNLFEALNKVKQVGEFDYIVLDLNLPDVDGLDGLMRLKLASEKSRIVVVSSLTDNKIIASAITNGAAGFVPKESARQIMIEAFQNIADGEVFTPSDYFPPRSNEIRSNNEQVLRAIASLTPQQSTILRLICDGKLNKQIAFDLSIAETTVKAHLTAIMRKLGVQNRTQAALMAKTVSFNSVVDYNG